MTTAKTEPRHGERRCYLSGCRRPECSDANKRYCKIYRVRRHRAGAMRVDAQPYAELVRRYADLGWSRHQIAEAAGSSETTVVNLLNGKLQRLNPDTCKALRTLPEEPANVTGRAYFDATGTIRRGRALYRIGHTVGHMAAELDLHPDSLSTILQREQGIVLASTAVSMTALYVRRRWTPGKFAANRTRATQRGWHGPLAWDDASIDDPDAKPEEDEPYQPADKYRRDPMRKAEIEHLHLLGESIPSIAKQLGGNEKYIGDQLAAVIRERAAKAERELAA
ncbi:hypothetical protein [Streptomyces sp. NBC_00932]|uniref:hypothetical protein n=1 Tax=Streptomyces sp. NBC_00932 TaxID=2903690 RepID=UPI0038708236|nr:hypothetical protein OG221_27580 [Streptomyces sp. NBC_00932]